MPWCPGAVWSILSEGEEWLGSWRPGPAAALAPGNAMWVWTLADSFPDRHPWGDARLLLVHLTPRVCVCQALVWELYMLCCVQGSDR